MEEIKIRVIELQITSNLIEKLVQHSGRELNRLLFCLVHKMSFITVQVEIIHSNVIIY